MGLDVFMHVPFIVQKFILFHVDKTKFHVWTHVSLTYFPLGKFLVRVSFIYYPSAIALFFLWQHFAPHTKAEHTSTQMALPAYRQARHMFAAHITSRLLREGKMPATEPPREGKIVQIVLYILY